MNRLVNAVTLFAICLAVCVVAGAAGIVAGESGQSIGCALLLGVAGGCGLCSVTLLRTIQRREREIFSRPSCPSPSPGLAMNPATATFESFDGGFFAPDPVLVPARFQAASGSFSRGAGVGGPATSGGTQQSAESRRNSPSGETSAAGFLSVEEARGCREGALKRAIP